MYEAVIGLEVHAQLNTRSKLFCTCPLGDEPAPNTRVCPVCLGHPGTLPVTNREAVRLGIVAGLATGCEVHEDSVFARKQYFYPDLPKGYQISQFDRPLATGGAIHIELAGQRRVIRITRIHLEEDAAKSTHDERGTTVDFNRGGTPLAEIVSEPDMRSSEEAEAYLRMLHRVLVEAGVTRGDMEKGHFRCDANVSVRKPGEALGTRTEIKNVNSFRFVAKAIDREVQRQIDVLEGGGEVISETRGWRMDGSTVSLRTKESSSDYRYFPDPDLPPLRLGEDLRAEARASLAAAPLDLWLMAQDVAEHDGFRQRYGVGDDDAVQLIARPELRSLFERSVALGGDPAELAKWVRGQVAARLNEGTSVEQSQLTPEGLVGLLALLRSGQISRRAAGQVLDKLWSEGGTADALVASLGLQQVGDEELIRSVVREAIAANPAQVQKYKNGNKKLVGFFMGAVMRATRGQADPALSNRLVVEELDSI